MTAESTASPIGHIVIPAPDLPKARDFYSRVFGWQVQANVPGPTYWFYRSGNVGGAFDARAKPARGAVVLILTVDDMVKSLALIEKNGGTITRSRSAIGEAHHGYDAYFLDPNGNEMGVYSER